LEMLATDVAEEAQAAVVVRSLFELSVNVPVAVNCCVVPKAIDAEFGVTAMETSVAALTVSVVVPWIEVAESLAVMVTLPGLTEVASPFDPAPLEILATVASDELQVADWVRSCDELSV
jgi:hypothetical protein